MLNFTDVAVRRGPRLLFAGASFGLFRGEKVGITGENGSGKSTLLELVRGTLHADAGVFEMPGNLVTAHVSQEIEASEQPAIEFVLDGDRELRAIEAQLQRATEQDDGAQLGTLHARYAEVGGYDARARGAADARAGIRARRGRSADPCVLRRLARAHQRGACAHVPLRPAAAR